MKNNPRQKKTHKIEREHVLVQLRLSSWGRTDNCIQLWERNGRVGPIGDYGRGDEIEGCGVEGVGWVIIDMTGSPLLTDGYWVADTPGPASYNWQVVQAVRCLWVTTYLSKRIIYFCPKVLWWFYFIPASNLHSICVCLAVWGDLLLALRECFCPNFVLFLFSGNCRQIWT